MTEASAGLEGALAMPVAALLERVLPELMPDLLRYFVRRLEDREDAADALAETLLVLWRKERRLPGSAEELRRYAFGVAAKVLGTVRRGRMRRSALADRLREDLRSEASIDDVAVLDPALRDALERLAPADKELVLLVAWDGFPVTEAGRLLGYRPEAARQRYSRARVRLRELLAD